MKSSTKHMLNKMSKYINRLIILAGFLFVGLNGNAQTINGGAKVIDRIVAQIGEEIILLSDIQNRRLELIQDGQAVDMTSDCLILEEMLFEKLLINQAQIDSIEIPDDMVNSEMENRIR